MGRQCNTAGALETKRARAVPFKKKSDYELSASEIAVSRWKREDRGEIYVRSRSDLSIAFGLRLETEVEKVNVNHVKT